MYTKGNENPLTVNIYIQYSKWMCGTKKKREYEKCDKFKKK